MHVRCPVGLPEERFREVLGMLADLSPVVHAVPPGAALVQLRGALRYHGTGARQLGQVARMRSVARMGLDLKVGVAATVAIAAMASAQIGGSGGVLVVEPEWERQWLGRLPVEALYGVGKRQAAVLRDYGVHHVALLAELPEGTVQRLLGAREGRLAWQRARGIDPRPVVPRGLPASASVRCTFERDQLDGAPVRAALLDLVVRLGALLRGRGQAAQALTVVLEFASGAPWSRTRRLAQASAHEEDLRAVAYRIMDGAGLQRARLSGLVVRAEDLIGADRVPEQATLDGRREARLRAEEVVDAARVRFGPNVMLGPAALLGRAS